MTPPTGRPLAAQIPRLARRTWDSLAPMGDTSSDTSQPQPVAPEKAPSRVAEAKADQPEGTATAESRPLLLKDPRSGKGDDLKLIWGVGPKLEKMLNDMGVWHFDQIASWGEAEIKWVDQRLQGFKGRALRDEWVKQAKKLVTGWRPDSAIGEKPGK